MVEAASINEVAAAFYEPVNSVECFAMAKILSFCLCMTG